MSQKGWILGVICSVFALDCMNKACFVKEIVSFDVSGMRFRVLV